MALSRLAEILHAELPRQAVRSHGLRLRVVDECEASERPVCDAAEVAHAITAHAVGWVPDGGGADVVGIVGFAPVAERGWSV